MSDDDKLEKLRGYVRKHCDLIREIEELKERLTEKNKLKAKMEFETLPDLFNEAGVVSLGIPAQGNDPAYEAKLQDYFKGNIKADWPVEQREAGFAVLEELNCADMIKHEIAVELPSGPDSHKLYKKLMESIHKLGAVQYTKEGKMVPWMSLTAMLKERYRKGKPLGDKQLRLLGATVGSIVKITTKKAQP